jgi:IMP dehydrogenase
MKEALCFDDVLLEPASSSIVKSRSLPSLFMRIGNPNNKAAWINLKFPIMIAPMEYISSTKMLNAISSVNGMGFVQRHNEINDKFAQAESLNGRSGFAINIDQAKDSEFINKILSLNVKVILLDTALGHTGIVVDAVKQLRLLVPDKIHIMVGNVSSYEAYKELMDVGADSVRVGIGGGAACMTRIETGFGVPVLTSIMDIYKNVKDDEINGIVADGGIKNNGDIVKAFAAGASAVMMGSMFAGHDECDGDPGSFRGLASEEIQIKMGVKNPYAEGKAGRVHNKGSVMKTIKNMQNSISSGCSYGGVLNLSDLAKNAKFIKVSQASLKESWHRLEI